MQIRVNGVDEKVFREFKGEAVKEGLKVGRTLNMAMMMWVWQREGKLLSLLDLKPVRLRKGTEHTSEQIDDILYGKITKKGKR